MALNFGWVPNGIVTWFGWCTMHNPCADGVAVAIRLGFFVEWHWFYSWVALA